MNSVQADKVEEDRFLTLKTMAEMVGTCTMTLRRWEKKGKFPKMRQLSKQVVGLWMSEFLVWRDAASYRIEHLKPR
jgi:predicted DNA-binding transcriptional regulator AlpA